MHVKCLAQCLTYSIGSIKQYKYYLRFLPTLILEILWILSKLILSSSKQEDCEYPEVACKVPTVGDMPTQLRVTSPSLGIAPCSTKGALMSTLPSWNSPQILTQARTVNFFLLGFWNFGQIRTLGIMGAELLKVSQGEDCPGPSPILI